MNVADLPDESELSGRRIAGITGYSINTVRKIMQLKKNWKFLCYSLPVRGKQKIIDFSILLRTGGDSLILRVLAHSTKTRMMAYHFTVLKKIPKNEMLPIKHVQYFNISGHVIKKCPFLYWNRVSYQRSGI